MKENVIISLADSNYFELLNELVDSIKRFKESEKTAICIMDAGLTDDQKSILSKKVDEIKPADWDIEVPDFKVKRREWLKSQVSRAFLPKYFPNYKKYLWIDADAWVNCWEAIDLYFKGCENNKLSIATSADRAYGRVLRADWFLGSFARIKSQNYKHAKSSGFSEKIARQVALEPHLNIPVIAIVDSNNSFEGVDYMIPGNDDSMSSIELFVKEITEIIINTKSKFVKAAPSTPIKETKNKSNSSVTKTKSIKKKQIVDTDDASTKPAEASVSSKTTEDTKED